MRSGPCGIAGRKGTCFSCIPHLRQLAGRSGWLDQPVVDGNPFEKESILYPVENRHYRDWRQRLGQGGDFMIYTDRLNLKLVDPIRVVL